MEEDSRPGLHDLGIAALSETWVISPLWVSTSLSAKWNQSTLPGRAVTQTMGHSLPYLEGLIARDSPEFFLCGGEGCRISPTTDVFSSGFVSSSKA